MSRFNYEISPKDITIKEDEKLGEGSFCVVYRGMLDGEPVAIKKPLNPTISYVKALFHEVNIMVRMTHRPQIARLLGFVLPPNAALVMEFVPGGNLFDFLQGKNKVPWSERYQIAWDTSGGVAYLHQQYIVHQDLKSPNILLDRERHAKISDFGISQVIDPTTAFLSEKKLGYTPIFWAAPELLHKDLRYPLAGDIYALGMIFFELLARKFPFQERRQWNMQALSRSIIAGDRPNLPEGPTDFKELIQRCWSQQVSDRPLAGDVIQLLEHICTAPTIPVDFTIDKPEQETHPKEAAPALTERKLDTFLVDIQFMQYVASGNLNQAEHLLKKTSLLAFSKFKMTDHGNREFSDITAFQYALWALDWRMYNMLAKYLPPDERQQQTQRQEAITQACGHGNHFRLAELLRNQAAAPHSIPTHIRDAMANTPSTYTIKRSTSTPSLNANPTAPDLTKRNTHSILFFSTLIEQRQKAFSNWSSSAPMPTRQQPTDELLQGSVKTSQNISKVIPISPQNQGIRRSNSASFFKPPTRIPSEHFNREQRQETLLQRNFSAPTIARQHRC